MHKAFFSVVGDKEKEFQDIGHLEGRGGRGRRRSGESSAVLLLRPNDVPRRLGDAVDVSQLRFAVIVFGLKTGKYESV